MFQTTAEVKSEVCGDWVHKSKHVSVADFSDQFGTGLVVQRFWVNFQCRDVLLIWIIVGQGPIALAVGAGAGVVWTFFSHLSLLFSFPLSLSLSLSFWETARYSLKHCLKGPLSLKQPTKNRSVQENYHTLQTYWIEYKYNAINPITV